MPSACALVVAFGGVTKVENLAELVELGTAPEVAGLLYEILCCSEVKSRLIVLLLEKTASSHFKMIVCQVQSHVWTPAKDPHLR